MSDEEEVSAAAYLKAKKAETARLAALQKTTDKDLIQLEKEHTYLEKDALRSTQNALKTLKDTEQLATKTEQDLKIQGETLDEAEKQMEIVDQNANENYKSAKKVKKHGHFLAFLYGRRAEKKMEIDKEYAEKKVSIESQKIKHQVNKESLDVHGLDSLQSKDPSTNMNDTLDKASTVNETLSTKAPSALQGERIYRNETDREIDQNLDEIDSVVNQLKFMTVQMGQEMDRQNVVMDSIDVTRDHTDKTLGRAADKIQKYAA